MKLLLDIGNTRLKWRMAQAEGAVAHACVDEWEVLAQAWRELSAPTDVAIGSVAGDAVNERASDLVQRLW
ncbi:MAG: type III pantothenate kinase, partial [Halothiobacillaceae bacterium]|nr:type III pantothenate kinase [Halothiobacillaceae bacterium]